MEVVEEASLNNPVDVASETKIESVIPSDLRAPKEPEGDEVFEEAVDDNLDDDAHSSKGESNDAVASVSSDVEGVGGVDLSGVDGVESEEHEDEVMLDARTLSDGFGSDDNEEVLVASLDDKGGTDNEGGQGDDERAISNEDGADKTQVEADREHEEKVELKHQSVEERGISETEGDVNVDDEPIQVIVFIVLVYLLCFLNSAGFLILLFLL